jgi:hypothetical protein
MPDDQGRLTTAEQQLVSDWLETKWVGEKCCPICKMDKWNAGVFVSTELNMGSTEVILGGCSVTPHIQLVCSNCGNTLIFNAVLLGIIPKAEA